jgi:hypothetical protein
VIHKSVCEIYFRCATIEDGVPPRIKTGRKTLHGRGLGTRIRGNLEVRQGEGEYSHLPPCFVCFTFSYLVGSFQFSTVTNNCS